MLMKNCADMVTQVSPYQGEKSSQIHMFKIICKDKVTRASIYIISNKLTNTYMIFSQAKRRSSST